MADPAVKEKAKELFVINGFSMDTILTMLNGEVSRKTLYNWRKEDNWEEQRKDRAVRTKNRIERLEALLDQAINQAEVNITPGGLFAIGKLITALKSANFIDFSDEKEKNIDDGPKEITPETILKIRRDVLGLEK
jgi:DNA-binding transcriptional MocR family regulator